MYLKECEGGQPMKKSEFTEPFEKLCKWYGKKVTDDQGDIWYEKMKQVPIIAFEPTVENWIDTQRNFPTPQDLLNGWYAWRQSHPQAITKEYECRECNGQGYIFYMRPSDLHPEQEVRACCHCTFCGARENRKKGWTREEIREKGWTLTDEVKRTDSEPRYAPMVPSELRDGKAASAGEVIRGMTDQIPF